MRLALSQLLVDTWTVEAWNPTRNTATAIAVTFGHQAPALEALAGQHAHPAMQSDCVGG